MKIQGLSDFKSFYAKCKITNMLKLSDDKSFTYSELPYKNGMSYIFSSDELIVPAYNDNELYAYTVISLDEVKKRYYSARTDFIVYKIMHRVQYTYILIFSDNDLKVGLHVLNYKGNMDLSDCYLIYSGNLCIRIDKKTWKITAEVIEGGE